MEPGGHDEVYLAYILPSVLFYELLNFSVMPGSYLFLTMTARASTFFALKGANPFCQAAYFFCMLKSNQSQLA